MKSFLSIRLLILSVAAHVAWAAPASAQQPQTPQTPPRRQPSPAAKPDSPAASLPPIRLPNSRPGITDKLPYAQWTRHLGPAVDALVTAEVALRDDRTREVTTQTGAGIIVRCDGLILLPACLFYTPGNSDRTRRESVMSVTLHAQATQGADIPASFTADVPRYRSPKAPFVLVKTREIRDKHFQAAALLHPKNLSGARAVEVVYPHLPASTNASAARTVSAKVQITEKPDGTKSLTFAATEGTAAPKLPPGAIVIDNESKMAIGIYAPPDVTVGETAVPAAESNLQTFARLHEVTNAIGMVPQPDDRLSNAPSARKPGEVQEGMVWIPGGPREIEPTQWQELQGAIVACGPGFWIDRTEVTVREYREFLRATSYRPLPKGWTEADITGTSLIPTPTDPSDSSDPSGSDSQMDPNNLNLPVRGVTIADAEAYAAWAGKRLVTPMEWNWASSGAGLAPAKPVIRDPMLAGTRHDDTREPITGRGGHAELTEINHWVRVTAPSWLSAYERVLKDTEDALRMLVLMGAYVESKFWSYWQDQSNPRTFFRGVVPPQYQTPQFLAFLNTATPSRTVADLRYAAVPMSEMEGRKTGYPAAHARLSGIEDTQALIIDMFDPLPISPVGSRPFDRSIYDVRDIHTNLPEWIQENRALLPGERLAKPLPALFDPVQRPEWRNLFDREVTRRVTEFNVALNGGDRFNFYVVRSHFVFPQGKDYFAEVRPQHRESPFAVGLDLSWLKRTLSATDSAATLRLASSRYPSPLLPFLNLAHPENAPDLGTSFRCAR